MGYLYTVLIPLLPLLSFLLLGLSGRKYLKRSSGIIATLFLAVAAALSIKTAFDYFFVNGMVNGAYQEIIVFKFPWLQFSSAEGGAGMSIDMGMLLDPISVMMLVVITFVSFMVHLYSLGYMKGEERFSTYYSFLGLFTFSMLGLVLSSNIFQTYIFWELVGVSSYLLIGFYFDRASAVAAAKKAFVVTRFADLGFLIGILILGFYGGTLDFSTLISRLTSPSPQLTGIVTASFMGISALTWALSLTFMGGAGKSAMFPLHIWLPDAMEGPTPVSALIHAATMVVAGVYLVARLFPVFAISDPAALQLVAYTGAFSALLAAVIACTQTDIKRVLAYSTMSQIGYMMFALGVSGYWQGNELGYTASMFHLFTHAFFKSLLFLGAGAIIHFVHSNEMKDMGGLRKRMPVTHITFLIACLAIAGIPPFAGFFSKEEILLAAFNSNKLIYGVALFTSGLTAFYMFRLYFSIFWNTSSQSGNHDTKIDTAVSSSHNDHAEAGEGTLTMKIPLIILAICTLIAGFVPFSQFVTANGDVFESEFHLSFSILPVLFALAGISIAYLLYQKQSDRAANISNALGGFYRAAHSKFYFDEIYLFVTKKIVFNLVGKPAAWVDRNVVDGTMNGIASATGKISVAIKNVQSGRVQAYAIYFFAGIVVMVLIFVYWWK